MKKSVIIILFFLCLQPCFSNGYHIDIQIKGIKSQKIYLCRYYGNSFIITDSIKTDKRGNALLAGPIKPESGLYFIALKNKDYFEFLMTDDKQLSINANTKDLIGLLEISGSEESKLYNSYQKGLHKLIQQSVKYQNKIKEYKYYPDSAGFYREKVKIIDKKIISYKEQIIDSHPNTFAAKIVKATFNPKMPDIWDQLKAEDAPGFRKILEKNIRYNREHYFDNIDFTDSRILNTPIYHAKLEHFFTRIIYPHPDSVIIEIDKVINKAEQNRKLYRYTLEFLLNQYLDNHENGLDKVMVYLANHYYFTGKADWANNKMITILKERVEILTPSLVGKNAKNLNLQDVNNKTISLYDFNSKLIVVFFWDMDCELCIKQALALRKIYKNYKAKGLEVYAVYTKQNHSKWKSMIDVYQLHWINVYDSKNEVNFGQWYNLSTIPTIFLLDNNKKILYKQIQPQKLEFILSRYL